MQKIPTSLYLHLPWCEKKCPYCDFNSHTGQGDLPFDMYVDAMLADARYECELSPVDQIQTVFIGGGTPSLIPEKPFERLMDGLREIFDFSEEVEITMEANPGSAEQHRFKAYHDAGVNRLSLGVQSFDDQALIKIGRIHDSDTARHAIDKARQAGIERLNLDLMFALPGQSLEQALFDIKTAIECDPEHISHYQLTLEPHTPFHRKPPAKVPNDDLAWDMQLACQNLLKESSFIHYEVSAYAKPSEQCRHNRNYWEFGDYIGLGAGAHGKRSIQSTITRSVKYPHPKEYMKQALLNKPDLKREDVDIETVKFEFMLNALRLVDGVPVSLFEQRTFLQNEMIKNTLDTLKNKKLIATDKSQLRTTALGQQFLNDVLVEFL